MSKRVLGIVLIVVGVGVGIYVGFWLMFVGGIIGLIQVVQNISAGVDALEVALNIGKILFASFIGTLLFIVISTIGTYLLSD